MGFVFVREFIEHASIRDQLKFQPNRTAKAQLNRLQTTRRRTNRGSPAAEDVVGRRACA